MTVAGSREELAPLLLEEFGGKDGPVTLVALGARAKAHDAALINGTLSHALDYDDYESVGATHPSVPILAALLPLAALRGSTLKCPARAPPSDDLLLAILASQLVVAWLPDDPHVRDIADPHNLAANEAGQDGLGGVRIKQIFRIAHQMRRNGVNHHTRTPTLDVSRVWFVRVLVDLEFGGVGGHPAVKAEGFLFDDSHSAS